MEKDDPEIDINESTEDSEELDRRIFGIEWDWKTKRERLLWEEEN